MTSQRLVVIVNLRQVGAYLSEGIKPVDVSFDCENNRIVFTFSKEETAKAYKKWKNKEYNIGYPKLNGKHFGYSHAP